jgi:hypothetical protein
VTPIDRLRAALDDAIPGRPAAFGLAEEVDGPRWYALVGLDAAPWCADDTAVTALGLAEVFGTAVLGRVLAALVLTGWAIDPADLMLHRHELGFVDAVALRRAVVLSGPADPIDRAAAAAVAVLGPVLDGIAAATRPAPLWDVVADSVRGAASTLTLYGPERDTAPDVADALVAALAAHGAPVRPARREIVHAAGRRFEVAARVTCCLLWTTVAAEERAAAYCTVCPHLDADTRATRFTAYAEQAQRQSPAG